MIENTEISYHLCSLTRKSTFFQTHLLISVNCMVQCRATSTLLLSHITDFQQKLTNNKVTDYFLLVIILNFVNSFMPFTGSYNRLLANFLFFLMVILLKSAKATNQIDLFLVKERCKEKHATHNLIIKPTRRSQEQVF